MDVRLRLVDALRNISPREEKYAGGIDVRAATVLNTGARVERQRGLGINRHLQRKLGTALIAELEGHDARLVAAGRVAAECDACGVDAALVRVLVEPANDDLIFLDLNRKLVFRRELVVDGVDLRPTVLGEEPHCGVELIERPDDITAAVQVHQCGAFGDAGLRRMIAANRNGAVWALKAQLFDLPDRGFVGVDEPIVRRALDVYRFVRAKDGAVLEPFLDLEIHCPTTTFLRNVRAGVDSHISSLIQTRFSFLPDKNA